MTVELIELLVGLYFIGKSISVIFEGYVNSNRISPRINTDWFKLVYGIILVVVALYHGVKI